MTGVLFSDIVSVAVAKLQALLNARPESYADEVLVSNAVVEGSPKTVTIAYAGGPGDTNTLDTVYLAVNIFDPDEGTCTDLALLVRALFTGRGPGSVCDGKPITHTRLNVGLSPIDDPATHHIRMVVEVQHRGTNL